MSAGGPEFIKSVVRLSAPVPLCRPRHCLVRAAIPIFVGCLIFVSHVRLTFLFVLSLALPKSQVVFVYLRFVVAPDPCIFVGFHGLGHTRDPAVSWTPSG